MMPILPFIEDTEENITSIVEKADYYGVKHIVPWIGMSLRDRQRDYYYKNLFEALSSAPLQTYMLKNQKNDTEQMMELIKEVILNQSHKGSGSKIDDNK